MEEFSDRAEDYYEYTQKVNAVTLRDIKKMAENVEYASFVLVPQK